MTENPILKTVLLKPGESVSLDLGFGYLLESNEMTYDVFPDCDSEVSHGRKFRLFYDGTVIHDFILDDSLYWSMKCGIIGKTD